MKAWQCSHLQAVALGACSCLQFVQEHNSVAVRVSLACLLGAVCIIQITCHRPAMLTSQQACQPHASSRLRLQACAASPLPAPSTTGALTAQNRVCAASINHIAVERNVQAAHQCHWHRSQQVLVSWPQTSLSSVQAAHCQHQDNTSEPQYNAPGDCLVDRTHKARCEPQPCVQCPSCGVSSCNARGQHSQCNRGLPVPAWPTSADMCPIAMFVAPEKSVVRPW